MDSTAGPRAAAVLLAGGSGRRVGGAANKVLLPVAGRPVLVWSVLTVLDVPAVQRLLVVVRREDRVEVEAALGPYLGRRDVWLVDGGAQRQHSEQAALDALRADIVGGEIDVVAIHDAARPLASAALWTSAVQTAHRRGGAVPATSMPGLLRRPGGPGATGLRAVQTPQAFEAGALLTAYDAAAADGFVGTDTAACLERYSDLSVVAVPGEPGNLKVTWAGDLATADRLLRQLTG